MRIRTFTPAILALVAALAFATSATAQEGAADGEVVEVQMITTDDGRFLFDPVGLRVEPGTTIRFVNASGQHNTASYSEGNGKPQRIPEGAEGWSSPIFSEEGATFDVTLDVAGVYDYYCMPHEMLGMVGRIVVGDPAAAEVAPTDELPPVVAENLPPVDAIAADEDGRLTHEEWQAQ